MQEAAAKSTGTQVVHGVRRSRIYPILVLAAYLPPVVYMHRQRAWLRGYAPESLLDLSSYFHAEVLGFLVLALLLPLTGLTRRIAFATLSTLYLLAVLDWISWVAQGRPLFFDDFFRAIQLAIFYPEFLVDISPAIKLKAGALLAYPVLVWIALNKTALNKLFLRNENLLRPILYGFAALAVALTPLFATPSYGKHNTFALMLSERAYAKATRRSSFDLVTVRRDLGLAERPTLPAVTALPAGGRHNIIYFVIETAPAAFFPQFDELLPSIEQKNFSENVVVFDQHYTTYPSTDRAIYSILTGKYPPTVSGRDWKRRMNYGNTFVGLLNDEGYRSYVLSTAPLSFYDDQYMMENIGVQDIRDIEATQSLRTRTEGKTIWDRAGLYRADLLMEQQAIETLETHFSDHADSPFLFLVAPQSSHAPFQCPPDRDGFTAQRCETDHDRIQENARWQFRTLNRLVRTLSERKQLENTIIIVTGDHGIRSIHETKLFSNQSISQESTFHVPLMIYSPLLSGFPRKVDHPTSHVDLAPTLLDVLELPEIDASLHGRNLFLDSPRTIYFLGGDYLPVDAYLSNGHFYMQNRTSFAYRDNEKFDFGSDRLNSSSDVRTLIEEKLFAMQVFLYKTHFDTLVMP